MDTLNVVTGLIKPSMFVVFHQQIMQIQSREFSMSIIQKRI